MMEFDQRTLVTSAFLGAIAVLLVHLPQIGRVAEEGLYFGANSAARLYLTGAGLFAGVVLAGIMARGRHWPSAALGGWSGACGALTVFVFLIGPGNLWPIALVIGGVLAAVPIALGSLLGAGVSRTFRRS